MKLRDLLTNLTYTCSGDLDTEVSDLVYDSRKAGPGKAFVCLPLHNFLKYVVQPGQRQSAEQPVQKNGGGGANGKMIVFVHPAQWRQDGVALLQHLRRNAMPGSQQKEHGPVRKHVPHLIEGGGRPAFPVFFI